MEKISTGFGYYQFEFEGSPETEFVEFLLTLSIKALKEGKLCLIEMDNEKLKFKSTDCNHIEELKKLSEKINLRDISKEEKELRERHHKEYCDFLEKEYKVKGN